MTTSKKRGSKQGHTDSGTPLGGQQAGVWVAGRGWTAAKSDDVGLARQVKRLMWEVAGASSMTGVRRDRYALALVRNRHRGALQAFGEPSILALLRRPDARACRWCAARALAASYDQPPPEPTPALRELLGTPCARCERRDLAAAAAEQERALLAAGHGRWSRPAPTGALWAADQGEPAGLTAAATRAARRGRP